MLALLCCVLGVSHKAYAEENTAPSIVETKGSIYALEDWASEYISILGSDAQKKNCFDAIVASAGYIRYELSHMVRLKSVPSLNFKFDTSYETGERIMNLIDGLNIGDNNE